MRGPFLRWCIYTHIYIGGRPLALLAGLADLWPGEQQRVPGDSQALSFKPPHQSPALTQLLGTRSGKAADAAEQTKTCSMGTGGLEWEQRVF